MTASQSTPGSLFPADTPQITIVAHAGEVSGSGSGMNLAWFQVTDEGETRLFTHTVEVGSFDAAYSVGTNPGTLAPGTYRVEAALEGESMSTAVRGGGSRSRVGSCLLER